MDLIDSLFGQLNEVDVDYCLLRNYEFLEGDGLENDIDILIRSKHRLRAETVLQENGFVKCRDEPTRHTYYLRMDPAERTMWVLHVCWDDVMYNTLPVASGSRILSNKVRHETQPVWVPSDEDMIIQLTFHSILNRGFFKEKYRKAIMDLSNTANEKEINEHASELFGFLGRRTIKAVRNGNFEEALGWKWGLVAVSAVKHVPRVPRFLYVLFVYYQLLRPIKRFNRRNNPFVSPPTIALVGADGTGKSTLTNQLTEDLVEMGIRAKRTELGVYNDETLLMKLLHTAHDTLTDYDHEADKESRRRGALEIEDRNSIFKSSLYFVDQLIRYLRANASGYDVLVADRYIHDVALYHHRYFTRLLPLFEGPRTLVFVLDAEPEVIVDRSEYDRDSIEEMHSRLSVLNHERINVSIPVSEVLRDLRSRISNSRFLSFLK